MLHDDAVSDLRISLKTLIKRFYFLCSVSRLETYSTQYSTHDRKGFTKYEIQSRGAAVNNSDRN